MSRRSLIEKVDELVPIAFEGKVFRSVAPAYAALSGEGARLHGGRWNPPSSFPVIYTSLDTGTAVLEVTRTAMRIGLLETDLLPRVLMTIRTKLGRVLDLSDPEVLRKAALTPSVLTDDDVRICQAIGDAANYLGFEAVLAPSAAAPGRTLAIFPNRLRASSSLEIVGKEILETGDLT